MPAQLFWAVLAINHLGDKRLMGGSSPISRSIPTLFTFVLIAARSKPVIAMWWWRGIGWQRFVANTSAPAHVSMSKAA